MNKGLDALKHGLPDEAIIRGCVEDIEKELNALRSIKKFIWLENNEIHVGIYGDCEIILKEDNFESSEEYNLVREALN